MSPLPPPAHLICGDSITHFAARPSVRSSRGFNRRVWARSPGRSGHGSRWRQDWGRARTPAAPCKEGRAGSPPTWDAGGPKRRDPGCLQAQRQPPEMQPGGWRLATALRAASAGARQSCTKVALGVASTSLSFFARSLVLSLLPLSFHPCPLFRLLRLLLLLGCCFPASSKLRGSFHNPVACWPYPNPVASSSLCCGVPGRKKKLLKPEPCEWMAEEEDTARQRALGYCIATQQQSLSYTESLGYVRRQHTQIQISRLKKGCIPFLLCATLTGLSGLRRHLSRKEGN
ncbi:uncharacterized protein LOC125439490 [Sphaerodactylus townsendi]|uniref:uncharacterized protein LOC125439490 n=1 Tax=Sphaerodactylus townsendi TaxID=933632 RepID=UPI0020275B3D|nr:uncharacterized protein LOC125439490 [Sphaerodactylus townsendi]